MSPAESSDSAQSQAEGPVPAAPEEPTPRLGREGPSALVVGATLALYAVLALWIAAGRDVWGTEARTALVVRTLDGASEADDWLTPRLHGEPFLEVPPLYDWLALGSERLLRSLSPEIEPRVAWRVPAIVAGVVGLWATFWVGCRFFGRHVAFLAMAIQGTTALAFPESTWVGHRGLFVVSCQVALAGFLMCVADSRHTTRRAAIGWAALACAALCGSVLGAVALVFLIFVFFAFFGGGVEELAKGSARLRKRGVWLVFPLLALPWFGYQAVVHGRELVDGYLVAGHLAQFTGESPSESVVFYVLPFLGWFLPWTVLLPFGFFHGKDRLSRPGERLCMSWFGVAFIALSILPAKHTSYLLFLWPPAALLISAALYEEEHVYSVWEGILGTLGTRLLPYLVRFLPVAALLGCAVVWYYSGATAAEDARAEPGVLSGPLGRLAADRTAWLAAIGISALAVVGGAIASRRVSKNLASNHPLAALESSRAFLFFLFALGLAAPLLDPLWSGRDFVTATREQTSGAPLKTYGRTRPSAVEYYLGARVEHFAELDPKAPVDSPEDAPRRELEAYLKSPERVYLILSQAELEDGLAIQFPGVRGLLHPTGWTGYLGAGGIYELVSNRE